MTDYSFSWRVQRITLEYAFVDVPLTEDLWIEQEDGTRRIDVEKMAARALEMGQASSVPWNPEEQKIRLYPIQRAPKPDGRDDGTPGI